MRVYLAGDVGAVDGGACHTWIKEEVRRDEGEGRREAAPAIQRSTQRAGNN